MITQKVADKIYQWAINNGKGNYFKGEPVLVPVGTLRDYLNSLVSEGEPIRNHHRGICFRVNEDDIYEKSRFVYILYARGDIDEETRDNIIEWIGDPKPPVIEITDEQIKNALEGMAISKGIYETDVSEDEGFTKPCTCGSTMHWQSHWECLTCKKGMK